MFQGVSSVGKDKYMVAVYALSHFLVDFACAFLVFRLLNNSEELYICFLLYNFCAFALQMPLGLLADRLNKNRLCAASGCVLVALAYGLTGIPVAAVVIAGIGNGLFHIGGGIDVLNHSAGNGKAGALGVFVSPGAFGIFLGKLLGKQDGLPVVVIIIMLLAAAALILRLRFGKGTFFTSENAPVSFDTAGAPVALVAAACLFLVVCLRSYVGMTLSFSWKGEGYWGWALIAAVVLGKTAGGFLADRLGAIRMTVISLGLSAMLFFLPDVPIAGVAAVLLFNMTMPVTLWAMARLFPGAKGFSFGLLTFGLFLGFVPAYLGYPPLLSLGAGYALAAGVSLALLFIGLFLVKRKLSAGQTLAAGRGREA
jgi:FSR family fosmidomycin resistance protein-like MFS transporter